MQTLTILLIIFGYTGLALIIGIILGKRLKKMFRQLSTTMSQSGSDLSPNPSGAIIRQFPARTSAKPLYGQNSHNKVSEKHGKPR